MKFGFIQFMSVENKVMQVLVISTRFAINFLSNTSESNHGVTWRNDFWLKWDFSYIVFNYEHIVLTAWPLGKICLTNITNGNKLCKMKDGAMKMLCPF